MESKRPRLKLRLSHQQNYKNKKHISFFDFLSDDILRIIADFYETSCVYFKSQSLGGRLRTICFQHRKNFLQTCQRFYRIGQQIFDSSVMCNKPLRYAVKKGYDKEVIRLLQDDRVDPSALDNQAIQNACENDHTIIVKLLLQDPRVDPRCSYEQSPLSIASINGNIEIVKSLLQWKRSEKNKDSLYNTESVDPSRVDPSQCHYRIIHNALSYDHLEIVNLLVQHLLNKKS